MAMPHKSSRVARTSVFAALTYALVNLSPASATTSSASHHVVIPRTSTTPTDGVAVTQGVPFPTPGQYVALAKVTITGDAAHHQLSIDFVTYQDINDVNCHRTSRGPLCHFSVPFDDVSSVSNYPSQYRYTFEAYPWLPASRQVAVAKSTKNPKFVRNLQVVRALTWGHHMVITVSTERFLGPRLRLYAGLNWMGDRYGGAMAISTYYRNASGTAYGTAYTYGDFANISDVLLK